MIIWRNTDWNIRLFADECIIYRKITNSDIEKLQVLYTLGEWSVENWMKINPDKSKAIRFLELGLKIHWVTLLVEASSYRCLGIILRSDLNWMDRVNYTVQKAWKAFHFVMRVLKKWNRNTKSLAYTSLVRPILEYGSACWDPCRGERNALHRVEKKIAQFANRTNVSDWETLAQRKDDSALFKATLGNGLGKLYATGCEGLIMFGKLGTGSKERISGSVPL